MSLPGPSGLTWALELLVFAGAFLPAGELLRRLAGRWVPLFRDLGWVERVLVDLYLGGGGLYVLAAVPLGRFSLPMVGAYLAGALAVLLVLLVRGRGASTRWLLRGFRSGIGLVPGLLVAAATAAVFGVEVFVAEGIPTGNSFDTSILTDYVALLLLHHQIPVSLVPIAPQLTSYPQGATVWLAAAQLTFSLPPARTPLLVTPLFLSLSPLAGYVLGRRQLGSPWAGALIGLTFALIGSWTRVMVATSNDFVFSFPLVLWLLARSEVWRGPAPPSWPTAMAYGALLGYSAALNPVGAEWLFPTLVVLGLLAGGWRWRYLRSAVPRWAGALAAALLFVSPALWTILRGGGALFSASGSVAVPTPPGTPGISPANLVGSIDPFLFRTHDLWLSPFPALRLELAGLLVVGAAVLVLPGLFRRLGPSGPPFRQLVGATIALAIAVLFVQVGSAQGVRGFNELALISSAPEISVYLFAIYTVLAALPLYLLMASVRARNEGLASPPAVEAPSPAGSAHRGTSPLVGTRAMGIALTVLLLVPGVVVTGTDFPSYLQELYGSYGRVTAGDFALFTWAGHGLPAGARVLVAPGSAAQFLPGYANVALVYPVQPIALNASYVDLVRELVGGYLTASGVSDLASLTIQYIAVTGNTTDLWAPFSPTPLLADGTAFPLLFESGDAYVFQVRG
ncbi:MAG: hypothetical protein L3K14_06735 [Thermoplasmata archaeon]|nr:hypothetical protein [Thermoplasmata archaeon]